MEECAKVVHFSFFEYFFMGDNMEFFNRIAENTSRLNKNDNEILSYCIRNHEAVSHMRVQEIAEALYTSPASVIRFCKKLGFSGFSEFKAALRVEIRQEPEMKKSEIRPIDFLKDIHKTTQLIQEETIEQILGLIHTKNRIEVYAVGSSRMVANEFAKRLQLIKKAARCYDDSSLMNVSAKQLTENDLVIALSASGESSLVIAAANMAKSRGASIVSITSLGSNTLSDVADINVYVKSTCFSKADIELCSRVQLLILCEYIFFRYLEWT